MIGSPIGVLFPILIAALAPFRIALEKFGLFSKEVSTTQHLFLNVKFLIHLYLVLK